MQRAVITGLGVISPIGLTTEEFWTNLTNGVSGVGPITQFDATGFPVRIAAEVKGFDPQDYMDHKTARRLGRAVQFAIAAAQQAIQDAGLQVPLRNGPSVGVVLATGGGGMADTEAATRTLIEKGPRAISPFFIPNIMPNAPACQISILTGAQGPILAPTAACASGNYALVEALRLMRLGEAEVVIAGGTESGITPLAFAALGRMGALSRRNNEPTRASRPFDLHRDGFVFGEGAAVMVMETEEYARRRGARIYAEVVGGGITGDAYHITAPEPDGRGAARAMTLALADAQMRPQDVDVIFAHGTSTPLNDVAETKAIKLALGEHAYKVAISATKSMIGHLLGAAAAASTTAAVLSVREGIIPPTINLETPDPECDLDYVPNVARAQRVRAAMVNGFGFGGQNATLIIRRYVE
ncbi:MAG: beta-ketoacyl-ACP synthase II [Anaerolineae bacterium]